MYCRWKVADRYVQRSFIDSEYGCSCASWVSQMIYKIERVAIVSREGVGRWADDRFATSRQGRDHVAVR